MARSCSWKSWVAGSREILSGYNVYWQNCVIGILYGNYKLHNICQYYIKHDKHCLCFEKNYDYGSSFHCLLSVNLVKSGTDSLTFMLTDNPLNSSRKYVISICVFLFMCVSMCMFVEQTRLKIIKQPVPKKDTVIGKKGKALGFILVVESLHPSSIGR